jgi:hypothetical protein
LESHLYLTFQDRCNVSLETNIEIDTVVEMIERS